MIDLHFHILPNVDDGPTTLDESLQMARFCVDDGTTHIIATPHCHRFIHLLRADVVPRVAQLNADLDTAGIPLRILPGSEIQIIDTVEFRREFAAGDFCHLGDGTAFTLFEFNWSRDLYPADAAEVIAWIRRQGMIPILAHPERYDYLAQEPHLLQAVVDAGAWLQVTADSLLGNHGPQAKRFAEAYLQAFSDVVLATDAHNLRRCSGLSRGYDWVRDHISPERAETLRTQTNSVLTTISPLT